ncbi:MAG: 6,7-dimethyl-8-ribityllumazine synthase [Candidatus Caenarcaniphilales bacterium]|nr:6,7-dimethyl-8-ribityllumazine synthase [Candidatus Caenarcaniphilales bacterium]
MYEEDQNHGGLTDLKVGDLKFAIIAGRWHAEVVQMLIEGARQALIERGVKEKQIRVFEVPGSFELPLLASHLAFSDDYHAIIALGVLVKGETDHYKAILDGCTQGLMEVMLSSEVPIGFGVLMVESLGQAQERAGGKYGNKGKEAALVALEMANLIQKLEQE